MNNTNFASKILKGRDVSAAPWINNYEQNGRSMIEMLGVLAIIGVLSVGGIAGYSKAMMKYKINKTIEQITLISGNVRSFFGPQKNYEGVYCECDLGTCWSAGDGCPILKKAKIIPEEMLTINSSGEWTDFTNAFGGYVALWPIGKFSSGDNKAFELDFANIPPEACIDLLSQDWTSSNVSAIFTVGKGGAFYFLPTPISLEDATIACSEGNGEFMFDLYFDMDENSSIWNGWVEHCSIAIGGC